METLRRAPDAPTVRATPAENLLTLLGGVWLIVGLFVDGYAHSEIIDTETEDFFTPWHGVFYSGFVFSTAVIAWIGLRRSGPTPIVRWLPPGYGLAAVGIVVFAIGGVGDGIWHTLFGVENGIDALLSPTHLLLFVGMLAILTAPLRAAWLDPTSRGTWGSIGGALSSAAITTSLIVFFFVYAFGLRSGWWQGLPFDPSLGSGIGTDVRPDGRVEIFRSLPDTSATEDEVSLGLSQAYVATVLLVVPAVGLLRRWELPRGALALLWGLPVLLQTLAFDGVLVSLLAVVVGAGVSEAILYGARGWTDRGMAIRVGLGVGVTILWSAWMLLVHLTTTVRWPPELWSGQIVMNGLLAVFIALVAFPPAMPAGPGSS